MDDIGSDLENAFRSSDGLETVSGQSYHDNDYLSTTPSRLSAKAIPVGGVSLPQWSDYVELSDSEEHASFASEELSTLEDEDMRTSYREKVWWEEADPEDRSLSDDQLITVLRNSIYCGNPHLATLTDETVIAFHKAVVLKRVGNQGSLEVPVIHHGSFFLRNGGQTIVAAIAATHPEKIDGLVNLDVAICLGDERNHVSPTYIPGLEGECVCDVKNLWYYYDSKMCFSNDFAEVWMSE
jgi:hypothetical protein